MKMSSIFLDGKIVRANTSLLYSLSPGIIEGKGVFETMRVQDGKICDLQKHLDRLLKGLKRIKVRTSFSREQIMRYLRRTLEKNGLKRARIRLTIWKEKKRLHIAIVCQPFKGYSKKKYEKGFHAVVSDVTRKKTRFSHIKSLDYRCFREAFLEARNQRYDEAILLNARREIVEGSRTNIFFVEKGVLYTPAIKCGALNGITRQQVVQKAREEKICLKAAKAKVSRLCQADEAFVTNSLMGIMPLTAVGGKKIGSGRIGPITRKLINASYTNAHSSCSVFCKSV